MVFRGRLRGVPVTASLKDTSVSLAADERYVVSWDMGGRLYSAWRFGHTWRRALNGQVLYKTREEVGAASAYDSRRRAMLDVAAAGPVLDEAANFAADIAQSMRRDPGSWEGCDDRPAFDGLVERLERCARFDASAAKADARSFAAVYRPVGILPPDQYLSTVLQATEGCSFGTCTFCDLYHDGYRVKSAAEFESHIDAVVGFLGESILLRRRSLFLGAANALAVPMPRLVELFESVARVFPPPVPPIRAFLDAFTGVRKDTADYAHLRELGLGRVYIGLESGHDPLLAFVRKPGTSTQAVETVHALREAGIAVGVIVMIGLGGERYAAGHVTDTARVVNQMGLGPRDLLYFSDLVEVPETPYPSMAKQAGLGPLDLPARLAQLASLRSRLSFAGRPPQMARYDVREFLY